MVIVDTEAEAEGMDTPDVPVDVEVRVVEAAEMESAEEHAVEEAVDARMAAVPAVPAVPDEVETASPDGVVEIVSPTDEAAVTADPQMFLLPLTHKRELHEPCGGRAESRPPTREERLDAGEEDTAGFLPWARSRDAMPYPLHVT